MTPDVLQDLSTAMTLQTVTTREAADRLCCSAKWVRALIQHGKLPAARIGTRAIRIRESDLAEFLAKGAMK